MNRHLRLLPLCVLPLLLASCNAFHPNTASTDDSPNLQPIRYYYNDISRGQDRMVEIATNGQIYIQERVGSRPDERRGISSNITDDERSALISSFKGWKKLDKFYPTDVSPQFAITYGGYTVTTSNLDKMPQNYLQAKATLDRIIGVLDKAADTKAAAVAARAASNAAATKPEDASPALPR